MTKKASLLLLVVSVIAGQVAFADGYFEPQPQDPPQYDRPNDPQCPWDTGCGEELPPPTPCDRCGHQRPPINDGWDNGWEDGWNDNWTRHPSPARPWCGYCSLVQYQGNFWQLYVNDFLAAEGRGKRNLRAAGNRLIREGHCDDNTIHKAGRHH